MPRFCPKSTNTLLFLLAALTATSGVKAAGCFDPSPNAMDNVDFRTVQTETILSSDQHNKIKTLLKSAKGNQWKGTLKEVFCFNKPDEDKTVYTKTKNYDARADVTVDRSGNMDINASLTNRSEGSSRNEYVRYYLGNKRMTVGKNRVSTEKSGVKFLNIDDGSIKFINNMTHSTRIGTVGIETINTFSVSQNSITVDIDYYHQGVLISTFRMQLHQ